MSIVLENNETPHSGWDTWQQCNPYSRRASFVRIMSTYWLSSSLSELAPCLWQFGLSNKQILPLCMLLFHSWRFTIACQTESSAVGNQPGQSIWRLISKPSYWGRQLCCLPGNREEDKSMARQVTDQTASSLSNKQIRTNLPKSMLLGLLEVPK